MNLVGIPCTYVKKSQAQQHTSGTSALGMLETGRPLEQFDQQT